MTTPTECVEVVEVTWKVPNFLHSKYPNIPEHIREREFSIGRRVATGDPQVLRTFPIKIQARLMYNFMTVPETAPRWWNIAFRVSKEPDYCRVRLSLLSLQTLFCENTLRATNMHKSMQLMAFDGTWHYLRLFDRSDQATHVNKDDGSLTIYFKLKVTFNIPKSDIATGGFKEMMSYFESLLKDPEGADVEIKVSLGKGQSFHCHKLILAARSEVFRAMFASKMKEAKDNVVEVQDIIPKTMGHFISFMYCGRFQDSSWIESLPQLAYAADKYCVEPLKNLCDSHLIKSVTSTNALALGKLAERHGLVTASRDIQDFLAKKTGTGVETCDDANFKLCYGTPEYSTGPERRL